jgi:hypothetical protein
MRRQRRPQVGYIIPLLSSPNLLTIQHFTFDLLIWLMPVPLRHGGRDVTRFLGLQRPVLRSHGHPKSPVLCFQRPVSLRHRRRDTTTLLCLKRPVPRSHDHPHSTTRPIAPILPSGRGNAPNVTSGEFESVDISGHRRQTKTCLRCRQKGGKVCISCP